MSEEQTISTTIQTENKPTTSELQGGKVSKKRTFKIKLDDNLYSSRITGNTPKQAASKALTLLIKQNQKEGKNIDKINFTIKETTRSSKQKTYNYVGYRIKLDTPTIYNITTKSSTGEYEKKTISNQYRNKIEKLKL